MTFWHHSESSNFWRSEKSPIFFHFSVNSKKLLEDFNFTIEMNAAERSYRTLHKYQQIYPWKSKLELASYLCKNIIHKADGLIAINKPFGVGLRTLTEDEIAQKEKKTVNLLYTPGCTFSLEDALPHIKKQLNLPKLIIVKAAEKYNTGVTVLAEDEISAISIRKKIISAKALTRIIYHYYMVTVCTPFLGVDGQMHGEKIGITLQQNPAHNVAQPVVVREFSRRSEKKDLVQRAMVAFGIKSYGEGKTTLIEFLTNETRRNLIRVYFADMLMPILGDHLYGQRVGIISGVGTRLNPLHLKPGAHHQKLTPELLELLELGSQKNSSIIPLHAHLHKMIIPNFYGKDKDLELHAPVQDYFKWTCDVLKLQIPKTLTPSF